MKVILVWVEVTDPVPPLLAPEAVEKTAYFRSAQLDVSADIYDRAASA